MKKIITSSRFLLPVGLLCLSCSWQVSSFVPQYSRHNQPVSFSSTTSHYDRKIELQMGLRDFLSKKARRKDNDEPPEKPAKKIPIKQTVEVPKSKLSTPPSPPKKAPPTQPQKRVRMGEDDDGNLNVDSLGPETVQQRIARFKRGEMSPEEKEAYLKSALSTGSTPESRLPMTQSHSRNDSTAQKPSPFPADSILRNMARGGKPPSEDYPLNKSDAQSKKQKYLDMVTDPHRFDKYKSSGSGASNIQQSPPVPAPAPTPIRQEIPPPPPAPANNDAQNNQINAPMDLGARLGAHAMEAEKRNAELRKQQEEKEQQLEEQRREREKRLAEAQKERQEEMARREAEVMRRRRKKETEMAKNQEEKIKQEKVRQTQLLKAQEDYWTRKLAENKKHAEMKEEDKKATEVTAAKSKGKEDAAAQAERAPEQEEVSNSVFLQFKILSSQCLTLTYHKIYRECYFIFKRKKKRRNQHLSLPGDIPTIT